MGRGRALVSIHKTKNTMQTSLCSLCSKDEFSVSWEGRQLVPVKHTSQAGAAPCHVNLRTMITICRAALSSKQKRGLKANSSDLRLETEPTRALCWQLCHLGQKHPTEHSLGMQPQSSKPRKLKPLNHSVRASLFQQLFGLLARAGSCHTHTHRHTQRSSPGSKR